jgi:dethiobiotin synthetase
MNGLFITSNNTDSGKTFISCEIIKALNEKFNIEVRKPIETGCEKIENILIAKDATLLQKACKNNQNIDIICPHKFATFASGEIASSKNSDENITLNDLKNSCQKVDKNSFLIIEGAGGFYSPIVKNALNSDLAKELNLPVVIIIEDKLGCISEALLTIEAVQNQGLDIFCVVLNLKEKNPFENATNLAKYTNEKIVVFENSKNFYNDFKKLI